MSTIRQDIFSDLCDQNINDDAAHGFGSEIIVTDKGDTVLRCYVTLPNGRAISFGTDFKSARAVAMLVNAGLDEIEEKMMGYT